MGIKRAVGKALEAPPNIKQSVHPAFGIAILVRDVRNGHGDHGVECGESARELGTKIQELEANAGHPGNHNARGGVAGAVKIFDRPRFAGGRSAVNKYTHPVLTGPTTNVRIDDAPETRELAPDGTDGTAEIGRQPPFEHSAKVEVPELVAISVEVHHREAARVELGVRASPALEAAVDIRVADEVPRVPGAFDLVPGGLFGVELMLAHDATLFSNKPPHFGFVRDAELGRAFGNLGGGRNCFGRGRSVERPRFTFDKLFDAQYHQA